MACIAAEWSDSGKGSREIRDIQSFHDVLTMCSCKRNRRNERTGDCQNSTTYSMLMKCAWVVGPLWRSAVVVGPTRWVIGVRTSGGVSGDDHTRMSISMRVLYISN